jgi:sugar O-acyltransferase (sialic acid O-acetyltransferase NeuD family)
VTDLILIGADTEIIELALEDKSINLIGIVDKLRLPDILGIPILGSDDFLISHYSDYSHAKLCITLDDVWIKQKLYNLYQEKNFEFHSIISKDTSISKTAKIQQGSIIQRGVNIGPDSKIGKCCKINVHANIMHDGHIGDFCTIAPNAVTLGYIELKSNVFLGANATILPNITIGENVIVGAGAVATKSLDSGKIYAGNPAKFLKSI